MTSNLVSLSKKDIERLIQAYDYDRKFEEALGNKLRVSKELTKEELQKIIAWKFRGRIAWRGMRSLNMLKDTDDYQVRRLSRAAFAEKNEEKRIEYLTKINGVGVALASCILAFYDPTRYGVLDIHVWRAVYDCKEPSNLFSRQEYYINLLERLRDLSKVYGINVRDLEIALFMKDRGSIRSFN